MHTMSLKAMLNTLCIGWLHRKPGDRYVKYYLVGRAALGTTYVDNRLYESYDAAYETARVRAHRYPRIIYSVWNVTIVPGERVEVEREHTFKWVAA